VTLLIIAGALNGFILPVTLATILIAAYKVRIVGDYKHPLWLTVFGVAVVFIMTYMSGSVIIKQFFLSSP
jgi:Mn2+/Fe2+ NRAMP family transporter